MALKRLKYSEAGFQTGKKIWLPLSKSEAARVAVVDFLAGGDSHIKEWPDCDDTSELLAALAKLRDAMAENRNFLSIDLGSGGTTMRFFTALASVMDGMEIEENCSAQQMVRPIGPLTDALRGLGGEVRSTARTGYPPLLVRGGRLKGGRIDMPADVSSQFISAVMMVAPYCEEGVEIVLDGRPVSRPYIDMTAAVMRMYGAEVNIAERKIVVPAARYHSPEEVEIEADWSAASYFYELALLLPGKEIHIGKLTPSVLSVQGDSGCEDIYGFLGVETRRQNDGSVILCGDRRKIEMLASSDREIELDMEDMPDLVPSLAVGMCLAGIRYRFVGISHLQHKECNRILALQAELGKIGFDVESGGNSLLWKGGRLPMAESESISTYGDHRMAMAFAPAAARLGGIVIENPEVVGKSFPDYWECMEAVGIK